MPAAMTATWLTTGSMLIVGLTALAAAFPFSGIRVVPGGTREGTDLRASRLAMLKDSGVQGEGTRSEGEAASKAPTPPSAREKAEGSGDTNDPDAKQQSSGKGRPGGEKGPGQSKSGAPRGKSVRSESGESGKQGAPKDQDAEKGKQENGRSENQADRAKDAEAKAEPGEKGDSKPNADGKEQGNQQARDTSNQAPRLPSVPLKTPAWLRMVLIAALGAALIFGLFRYGIVILLALRDLLASIFGGFFLEQREKRAQESASPAMAPPPPSRPFASFVNPFANGLARKFTPDDLILYSYEALEAWASDHHNSRALHETPTEFIQRLGESQPDLCQHAAPLVRYYVAIVYGQKGFQADVVPALRQFWTAIQGVA